MQMTMAGDTLVVQRGTRTIALQRVSAADKYAALLTLNVRPAVAQALVAGLVTLAKTV